jgi:4-amino-4-deoxy-L-arabinose transferase-like glycosyltransferase
MWIVSLIVGVIVTLLFILFFILFLKRINEELLRLENKIDKYNTTIALFAGFLITFQALTFNNKLSYEMELQKIEIKNNALIAPKQQKDILHQMDLASNDRIYIGTLASIDLSLFILLLLFGTFLPGQILSSKRNRKIYIISFICSFYLLLLIIAGIGDNLLR